MDTIDTAEKLARFLLNRIYIIDMIKKNDSTCVLVLEERSKNLEIKISRHALECSCNDFNDRMIICDHIKFTLNKLHQISRLPVLSLILSLVTGPDLLKSDYNPRYKEYIDLNRYTFVIDEAEFHDNCYICLEKMSGRVSKCKQCNKHYHESCIHAWLRNSPMCKCPNCRGQWY